MPCYPLGHWGFLVLATSRLIWLKLPRTNSRMSPNSLTTYRMLESLLAWCFSWTNHEKINFFINSRQRTSLFSVCLSVCFQNRAPQNRRFPSPVHDNNPASRSPLTLNSRPLNNPIPDPEKPIRDPLLGVGCLVFKILILFYIKFKHVIFLTCFQTRGF